MSDLIPAGIYKATAIPVDVDGSTTYAQFGVAGEKKTKQVLVTFEILEGSYTGRKVPWWGYFTQKAWENTLKSLRACGFKGDDLCQLPIQELTNEVSITIEHSEWQGKTNARVAWVNAPSTGIKMANPMSTDDLRQFAAQMKSKTASIKEVEGKKAERGAPPSNGATSEPPPPADDCPF